MVQIFGCMCFAAIIAVLAFAFGFAMGVAAMKNDDESR